MTQGGASSPLRLPPHPHHGFEDDGRGSGEEGGHTNGEEVGHTGGEEACRTGHEEEGRAFFLVGEEEGRALFVGAVEEGRRQEAPEERHARFLIGQRLYDDDVPPVL